MEKIFHGLPSATPVERYWPEKLRCGGELLFLLARRAREAAVHDLVEQRLVADLQQARGLGPVPVDALEHVFDGQTLGVARRAPRDGFEAHDGVGDRSRRRRAGPRPRDLDSWRR